MNDQEYDCVCSECGHDKFKLIEWYGKGRGDHGYMVKCVKCGWRGSIRYTNRRG